MARVYKVTSVAEWSDAKRQGVFDGAAIDRRDGYIHLSTGDQVERTVELYFAERDDLVLISLESDDFADSLKWEPSRGGDLFPHLYATFAIDQIVSAKPFSSRDVPALRSLLAEP